jgi:hypothetical protein
MKATGEPILLPRLLRFRDAPRYLGMDRNRIIAEARPFVRKIRISLCCRLANLEVEAARQTDTLAASKASR